jgi:hypothetical protein
MLRQVIVVASLAVFLLIIAEGLSRSEVNELRLISLRKVFIVAHAANQNVVVVKVVMPYSPCVHPRQTTRNAGQDVADILPAKWKSVLRQDATQRLGIWDEFEKQANYVDLLAKQGD